MVVRFVPTDDPVDPRPDREESDLAEVIDFRSRLSAHRRSPVVSPETEAAPIAQPQPRTLRAVPPETMQGWHDEDPVEPQSESVKTARLTRISRVANFSSTEAASESDDLAKQNKQTEVLPRQSAYEDAVRVLARRALARGELEYELLRLGHTALDTEIVLDEFIERLYLDDVSLAQRITEKLRDSKGASRSHIKQKLRERKISDEVIAQVLATLDEEEEYALLRDAAFDRARKLGGLDRTTAERRLLGFLARRGWSGEGVHRAVREALDGDSPKSHVKFE